MRSAFFAIVAVVVLGIASLPAQTTVTLSTSANPAVFGQPLTLTATVNPSVATGKVTFYDGAAVLGISPLNSGRAVVSTEFVQSGNRSLKAYYTGDGTHSAASSAVIAEKVTTAASNGFAIGSIPVASKWTYFVVAADFNGDGKPDLAVDTYDGLTILLGNGDGTFRTAAVYPGYFEFLAVGDFNLDGKPDLAYLAGQSLVGLLTGNGDGTFQPGSYFSVVGQFPSYMTVGDFNGDGKPDLAVAVGGSQNVSILIDNGDGTFQAAVPYTTGPAPDSIAAGDFNGDGKTDLAVTNAYGVDILLGNGDGSFRPSINYSTESNMAGLQPACVAIGDFNGDGKLDLVVTNWYSSTSQLNPGGIGILLGNGDGTFQPVVNYAASNSSPIAISDFNGDGKLDLALGGNSTQGVSILLGKGDGTFQPPINQPGWPISSFAIADLDGNGVPDIFFTSTENEYRLGLLLGSNSPDFSLSFTQTGPVKQGQTNLTYVLSAANDGYAIFAGQVQLSYTLGSGLTVTNTAAPGWTCTPTSSGATCNRGESLAPGQSYPSIVLTVNASTSAPYTVTSNASLAFLSQTAPPILAANTTTVLQNQTITFPAIADHIFGDPSFSINVSANSGLAVTVLSSGTCSILGSVVTIDGSGTCTLSATQAGNDYWAPAAATRTFNISGQSTSVVLSANPDSSQFGKPVTLTATITPSRTLDRVTFFDGTSMLGVAPVVAGTATMTTSLLAPGRHSLKAYYGGLTSASVSLTINAVRVNAFVAPSQ